MNKMWSILMMLMFLSTSPFSVISCIEEKLDQDDYINIDSKLKSGFWRCGTYEDEWYYEITFSSNGNCDYSEVNGHITYTFQGTWEHEGNYITCDIEDLKSKEHRSYTFKVARREGATVLILMDGSKETYIFTYKVGY